jgi:hypothetical protein
MTNNGTGDGKPADGKPAAGLPAAGVPAVSNKTEPNTENKTNTPPPAPTILPDWLPQNIADMSRERLEGVGLELEDIIERYLHCGYFGAEKPNAARFSTWVGLEVQSKALGKTLELKHITTETPEDMEQAFQQFWEAYPKKERITSARAAFKTALTKTTAAILIAQSKGYARSVTQQHREPQYIMTPTNWLTGESWLDTYPNALNDLSRTAADY